MKRFIKTAALFLIFSFISSLTLVSCKSKSTVVGESANKTKILKSDKIIEKYNNNKSDFSTLYIKSSVRFTDSQQSQNVSAEIKIEKDKQILISVRYLGFIVAKALITPLEVKYYEKIRGEYFEGDYSTLSAFLGTELDYFKLQNLLLGRAIDDFTNKEYLSSFSDPMYRLDDLSDSNTKKSFYFDSDTFLVNKQEITQVAEERMVQIAYLNKKEDSNIIMPMLINLNTTQKNAETTISIEYNSLSFNEEVSFPYSVPNDYKRIIIK